MTFWKSRRYKPEPTSTSEAGADSSHLREYVASMAAQLAILARSDGDRKLAEALENAAQMARQDHKDLV